MKEIEILKKVNEAYNLGKVKNEEALERLYFEQDAIESEYSFQRMLLQHEYAQKLASLNAMRQLKEQQAEETYNEVKEEVYLPAKNIRRQTIDAFMKKYGKISHDKMCQLLELETGREWRHFWIDERRDAAQRRATLVFESQKENGDKLQKRVIAFNYVDRSHKANYFSNFMRERAKRDNFDWLLFYLDRKEVLESSGEWSCDIAFSKLICKTIENHHFTQFENENNNQ